jgi:hypothetical protein
MGTPVPPGQQPPSGYGPPPFEPSTPETSKKRGKGPMKTGLVMMAVGLVAGAALLAFGISKFPNPDEYPRASGENQSVELTVGEWTVFAEDGVLSTPQITAPDGEPVPVDNLSATLTYTRGGRTGEGIGTIYAPVDGTYLVTTESGATVAFAQGFGSDLAKSISGVLAGLFLGGGLLLVGFVLTIIALTKRRR